MQPVAERHVGRKPVDPLPRNVLAGGMRGGQLTDGGALNVHAGVTRHAGGGGRKRCLVARVWHGVAGRALEAEREVLLVAVGERLFGGRRNVDLRWALECDCHEQKRKRG